MCFVPPDFKDETVKKPKLASVLWPWVSVIDDGQCQKRTKQNSGLPTYFVLFWDHTGDAQDLLLVMLWGPYGMPGI